MHTEDVCVVSVGMILPVYECVDCMGESVSAYSVHACGLMCEEGCECVYKECVCIGTVCGRELLDMCVVST